MRPHRANVRRSLAISRLTSLTERSRSSSTRTCRVLPPERLGPRLAGTRISGTRDCHASREAPCAPSSGARASRVRRRPPRWSTRSKDASIASKGSYQIPPYHIGASTTPYYLRKAHRERERVLRGGIYAPWSPRRKDRRARTIVLAPSGPLRRAARAPLPPCRYRPRPRSFLSGAGSGGASWGR
jgi:hypothetical protein